MLTPGMFMSVAANQARINRAENAGDRAAQISMDVRTQNEAIMCDVEKLLMVTEALWTFIKREHGLKEEDLITMVEDIDLRDGKLDGKVAKQENPDCPHCGRKLMRNNSICIYCGAVVSRSPFER